MGQLERVLGVVSHPNVAYVLFLLGLVGPLLRAVDAGRDPARASSGGISLLLALYAFSVLPVNLAGLALILFAILLFVAEIKVVSHGLLVARAGRSRWSPGSLLLFSGKGDAAGYRVDLGIIVPGLALALGDRRPPDAGRPCSCGGLPVRTGLHAMVGRDGARRRAGSGPGRRRARSTSTASTGTRSGRRASRPATRSAWPRVIEGTLYVERRNA